MVRRGSVFLRAFTSSEPTNPENYLHSKSAVVQLIPCVQCLVSIDRLVLQYIWVEWWSDFLIQAHLATARTAAQTEFQRIFAMQCLPVGASAVSAYDHNSFKVARRPATPLYEFKPEKLENFVKNYRDKKAVNGPYPLVEILREIDRRAAEMRKSGNAAYGLLELACFVIECCQANPQRQVSYREVYEHFMGEAPTYPFFFKVVADSLYEVTCHCYAYGLPFVSALVVQDGDRTLSADAKQAFWDDWGEKMSHLGAANREEFCEMLTRDALEVTLDGFMNFRR